VSESLLDQLTDRAGHMPGPTSLPPALQVVRVVIPIVFTVILAIPAITYFGINGAAEMLFGADVTPEVRFYTLFRLFGLYAFTFVWGQIMVGPFMEPLGRLYGRNWFYFHRAQGIFALLLALLHPLIFYSAYIIWTGSYNWFAAVTSYTPHPLYVILGETALLFMVATVTTALLQRHPRVAPWWHRLHVLNYVVFVLVWVHSYLLGQEAHAAPMSWLYPFFGLTFLAAVVYRRWYQPNQKRRHGSV
jgi:DMSO/TMAO reductase YedYZ heme-binding membrane subunit